MKPSFRYTAYQHGYELKHLHGTIEAIDGAQVEVGNTLKEQSLINIPVIYQIERKTPS